MKRWIMLLVSGITVVALSGCGGGSTYDAGYDNGYNDGLADGGRVPVGGTTTLFLIDLGGYSLGGVPYSCVDPSGAVTANDVTAPNGEFTFIPGERCSFNLFGYDGTPADPIFVTDDTGIGKADIPYVCDGGDNGLTDTAGSFDYLPDDICTLYL